jgi:hypothetical protein
MIAVGSQVLQGLPSGSNSPQVHNKYYEIKSCSSVFKHGYKSDQTSCFCTLDMLLSYISLRIFPLFFINAACHETVTVRA